MLDDLVDVIHVHTSSDSLFPQYCRWELLGELSLYEEELHPIPLEMCLTEVLVISCPMCGCFSQQHH